MFGFVLDVAQEAAFTGELTIRYERPTPLHRPIACRGRLARRDGRKLHIEGELVDITTEGQPVVARARSVFISVDPSVFETTQQLPAPPDEDWAASGRIRELFTLAARMLPPPRRVRGSACQIGAACRPPSTSRIGAGDVLGLVGGQEHGGRGDVERIAVLAAQRDLGPALVHLPLACLVGQAAAARS